MPAWCSIFTSPVCAAHRQSQLPTACGFPCRHARSLSIYREGLEAFHKAYPFLVGIMGLVLANGLALGCLLRGSTLLRPTCGVQKQGRGVCGGAGQDSR